MSGQKMVLFLGHLIALLGPFLGSGNQKLEDYLDF
jgi:hypothetical protein